MKSIFVDSFYFIALLNPRDAGHARASAISPTKWSQLVTTEWVLIETGNSLATPALRGKFTQLIDKLRLRPNVEIVYSSQVWFEQGLSVYRQRADKQWSLTDCLSFCVMESRGIREALTADSHFEQAGFAAVLRQ